MQNQSSNSPDQDASRPALGRRSTSIKTAVRSSTRDRRAREGSVAYHQQSQAPTGDLLSLLNQAPEGGSSRNSGILTQSVRFDPESTHAASTPISVRSTSDQESEEESAEEDEDEEYDADATRTSISVPDDLDGNEQGEVVPETPHEDLEEEQQGVEGFGGPDIINIDLDPTGPIPRWPQAPAPAPTPRPFNAVLGKRERSLDLAEYYYERLKSSYADEESEVKRARSLGVETPQGREALERATWKRRETRDLRQELRVWVTPLSRPLDPNVAAVSKTLEGLSVTVRESFSKVLKG